MNRSQEKGNALWFILIAVVLLALLTGILSRSGSSVDQSGDVEQLRIKAGQIFRTVKGIEAAIQQMKLRGLSENDISFENTVTAVDYTNANCTVSKCKIFDSAGGGQTYRDPPSSTNDGSEWIFTGAKNVGTAADPVGTTAAASGNDLLILLPAIRQNLCEQINKELGVTNPSSAPPVDTTGIATTAFTGSFPGGGPTVLDGDPAAFELNGHAAGCFLDDAASTYYFYHVLLTR